MAERVAARHGEADRVSGITAADRNGEQDGRRRRPLRSAIIVGIVVLMAVVGLVGWLGYQAVQSHKVAEQRNTFAQVVRQAKSKSVGEVTSAGLESDDPGQATVLVAVTVRTSNNAAPEQEPRGWRMRIVKQIGPETKVANVEFVP